LSPAGGDGFSIAPEARESEIKSLEALLETEADMKRAAEEKSAGLSQELERMHAQFSELQAFADVVSAGIAKGMSEGLKHGAEHGHAQRTIESLEAYDLEAKAKFAAALQSLKDLKLPLLDHRAEQKKRSRIVCRTHGVGSAHHAGSDRVPVSAPIVVPQGLALILVDAATQ
nr:hypothetical protein [Tanacetum cinerariifolium]